MPVHLCEDFVLKGDVGEFKTNLPDDAVVDSGGESRRSPVSTAQCAGYTRPFRPEKPLRYGPAGQDDSDHGTPETQ